MIADALAMKMNTSPTTSDEVRSYVQLQKQIHDALRVEHPEWVEPNGDCPTCQSYESRLAELLSLSSPERTPFGCLINVPIKPRR
jgi:hypothetical protein